MARLFRGCPEAIAETQRFARASASRSTSCNYNYPDEPTDPVPRARRKSWSKLTGKAPAGAIPRASRTRSRAAHRGTSSRSSRELNYARYFLTVHDIVSFARSQGDPLPGARLGRQFRHLLLPRHHRCRPGRASTCCSSASSRRSATSRPTSTSISSMRGARRSSQYIYEKYSRERAGIAATVITYRAPLGLARGRQGHGPVRRRRSARSPARSGAGRPSGVEEARARRAGLDPTDQRSSHVLEQANEILGFPATSPSMSAASSSPRTGSTRSCRSSSRPWTSAR